MSIVVGLTGPTGAGKSAASEAAAELGIKVINCDKLARDAVKHGSDGLDALIAVFGDQILLSDGNLNRKALARVAFSSKQSTDTLNQTILPFIIKLVKSEMSNNEKVLLDAPTLFESGLNTSCNFTISVLSDNANRLNRIITRDNLTLKEAQLRMSAGKNDDYYINRSDYILKNNGDRDLFISKAKLLFIKIFGGY